MTLFVGKNKTKEQLWKSPTITCALYNSSWASWTKGYRQPSLSQTTLSGWLHQSSHCCFLAAPPSLADALIWIFLQPVLWKQREYMLRRGQRKAQGGLVAMPTPAWTLEWWRFYQNWTHWRRTELSAGPARDCRTPCNNWKQLSDGEETDPRPVFMNIKKHLLVRETLMCVKMHFCSQNKKIQFYSRSLTSILPPFTRRSTLFWPKKKLIARQNWAGQKQTCENLRASACLKLLC